MFKGKIIKWLICLVVMCGLVGVGFAMGGKQEAEVAKVKSEKMVEEEVTKSISSEQKLIQYSRSETKTLSKTLLNFN
jgi:hypothetical protein